jgi:tRNA modification GTPase
VEQEGIRRAKAKALESDVVVVLVSIEQSPSGDYFINYDLETLELLRTIGKGAVVLNKRDVVPEDELSMLVEDFQASILDKIEGITLRPIPISCREAQSRITKERNTGGVHAVVDCLVSLFVDMTSLPADQQDLHGVTERQRQLLVQCRTHLEDYVGNTASEDALDELNFVVAAEDLRYAANCLARITGRGESGDIEEVLGVIFEK